MKTVVDFFSHVLPHASAMVRYIYSATSCCANTHHERTLDHLSVPPTQPVVSLYSCVYTYSRPPRARSRGTNGFARNLLYSLFWISQLSGYIPPDRPENKELWITILVHGNISIKPYLSYKNIVRLMCDAIDNTEYEFSASCIRLDPFFYEVQQMQDLGIQPIDKQSLKRGDACAAFAQVSDLVHEYAGLAHDVQYYTFGWSGLMSHKKRIEESHIFYEELVALKEQYTAQGFQPKIRIIGYSHGGNLALNLAHAHETRTDEQKKLSEIDQIILLGMPVQSENAHYVESPLFKKVYHFYSSADKIQRIDCFSFKRFFSRKRFKRTCSKNLMQIEISLFKDTFDYSPGHTELWFFGWTPLNYRAEFPLYPLSLVHIVPWLLAHIMQGDEEEHLRISVYPEQSCMKISPKKGKKIDSTKEVVAPFLSPEQIACLAATAITYAPEKLAVSDENEHVQEALSKGKIMYKELQFSKQPKNLAFVTAEPVMPASLEIKDA